MQDFTAEANDNLAHGILCVVLLLLSWGFVRETILLAQIIPVVVATVHRRCACAGFVSAQRRHAGSGFV
jgi:hypothetical protein